MNWVWITILFVIADLLIVVGILFASLRIAWAPLSAAHPFQPPAIDAVHKRFQSFRVGVLNLGYCVHVAVDDGYLHLIPATLLCWLGARPTSIPWDAIQVLKRSRLGKSMIVQVGKRRIAGPTWCMELAGPAESNQSESRDEEPGLTHDPSVGSNHDWKRGIDRAR